MIHCKFTSFGTQRGRLFMRAPATAAAIALAVMIAGCQDIPIARQRLAELVAPRDARVVPATPASSATAAAPAAASAARSSRSSKPRDFNNPYPLKPGDTAGYSLHM
ncbi:hypothetical protein QZM82_31810 [Burkholderia cepacia]|uniref:hypothetical protein n=1 Tax=Burkholderia cepacia TaxID=292 RepID=UPI0026561511|nr:hypothetical protein [Burkholderia cepacia]MDN7900786.1 hypothetical protein [Burkholderia cepacia]